MTLTLKTLKQIRKDFKMGEPTQLPDLVDWLKACQGVQDVKPCTVYIYGKPYIAAWYERLNQPLLGAQNQASWYSYAIYCIGDLPPKHRHSNMQRLIKSTHYWWDSVPLFIGGYAKEIAKGYEEFSPFGPYFQLMLDISYEWDKSVFKIANFTTIVIEWM